MARQPYMGLGFLFPRLLGLVHLWQWVTGPLAALFDSILTDCQSHLAVSQETWVRNGRWILLASITSSIHARKVLLNLRQGTDGFTSPPKEVVLRIFITLKNQSNPRTLGPVASTLTTSPPRSTMPFNAYPTFPFTRFLLEDGTLGSPFVFLVSSKDFRMKKSCGASAGGKYEDEGRNCLVNNSYSKETS
jgi:hypothetical protein